MGDMLLQTGKLIEYGHHLFQDTLEMNWMTACHAHLILLQEIEREKRSWKHPNIIEKNPDQEFSLSHKCQAKAGEL